VRQFDWPITKKKIETLEAPQKYNVLYDDVMFPFWPNYTGGNFKQTIYNKIEDYEHVVKSAHVRNDKCVVRIYFKWKVLLF
jgi:hypothetical protein